MARPPNEPPGDRCPCCNAVVSKTLLLIDLGTNVVVYDGKTAKLGPVQAEILHSLKEAYPHLLTTDELVRKTYGLGEGSASEMSIYQAVSQMKPLIAPLGLDIIITRTTRRSGRRLFFAKIEDPYVNGILQSEITLPKFVHRPLKHGWAGYRRGCRCDECVTVYRKWNRDYKAKRRSARKS